MKLYVDTNVYLDYCLGSNSIVPLDEFAKQILDRALECEFKLVISDLLLYEIKKKHVDPNDLLHMLSIKDKIISVEVTSQDMKISKNIPVHFSDNLHLALAQRSGCDYFVTNDKELLDCPCNLKIVSSQFFQFD
jgi:predicted nucleic acid-binding protein